MVFATSVVKESEKNKIYLPEPQTKNPLVLLQIAVRVLVEVVMVYDVNV